MKKEVKNIFVCDIGALDINIPLIKYGNGDPKILIICGMHGDETTGIFVVNQVLESLDLIKGSLSIMPSANSLAQAFNIRVNPLDHKDLNRIYGAHEKERGISVRIARKIYEHIKEENYDLVLDFHTFFNETEITVVYVESDNKELDDKIRKTIKLFQPSLIMNGSIKVKEETRRKGSLKPILIEEGRMTFGVEFPQDKRVTQNQIKQAVEGLENILSDFGMINKEIPEEVLTKKIPLFVRQEILAEKSGLFVPRNKIMNSVKEGDYLGDLVSLKDFEKNKIYSEYNGLLTELSYQKIVRTGDKIYTVGKILDQI